MVGMGCRNSETPVTDQLVKTGLAAEEGAAVQCNVTQGLGGGLRGSRRLRQDKGGEAI